jgi:hypothetical protein
MIEAMAWLNIASKTARKPGTRLVVDNTNAQALTMQAKAVMTNTKTAEPKASLSA